MVGNSKITGWGEQESSRSSASLWTPSAQTRDRAATSEEPSRLTTYKPRTMARVYSIPTLLKLGQMKQPARIELRISPAALAENVFKIPSLPPRSRLQENLHPRRQTQSSSFTGRSTSTEEEAMYDSTYVRPLRQPYNPPEVSLIQKHAGFARFLKQHASPPHHRVTAGGRIVPAGPLSPPPMMLLPYSLDTVVAGTEKSNANKPQTTLAQTDRKVSGIPKTPVGPSAAPLTQQHVNIDQVKQDQELDTFANPQYAQFQPTLGQNGPSFGPTPFGTTPIGFLPDGSSFVLYNGANYQNFWDGRSVVMKPLQLSAPTLPQTGYNPMLYPQMAGGGQYYGLYGLDGPHQDTNGSMPTTNGKSQALNEPQQLSAAQPEGPQAAHERLTSELNALDKYAALHLHEFSAIENTQYTSRRRQLVQQLDSLRAVTENDRLAPGFGPRALAAPSWLSANNVSESSNTHLVNSSASNIQTAGPTTPCNANAAPVHLPNLGLNQRLAPPRTSNNKCLSPDAPPFIPSGAKAAGPDYFGTDQRSGNTGTKSWERRAVTRGTIAGGLSAQKIHDQPDGSVRTSEGKIMGPGEIDRDSSPTDLRRYLRAEPHEPETLPVVTFSDIEYANVPGFNPVGKPKLYCTTIWEFQEVLRRVREQAQLYGCKGGQSKDPAYDAEQDIRWAMADGEPIPLPKSPADHVAHPRPWSWDDSAFNYRPEVAISPAGSKSHAHEEVQQSLSHHVGKTTRSRADSWTTNPSLEDFTVGGRASSSDNHKQHQRHEQDVSGPPAKSKTDGGCIMPIAGLSEQSQNTQQVAASSIQELSRSTYWPSSRSTKRQGSRIGDVGINLMLNSTDDDGDRDSDALSFDSQGIPRPHFIDPGKSAHGSLRAAKVNLPQTRGQSIGLGEAACSRPDAVDRHRGELQAVHFARLPSDASSAGILRGMLKSPRFSAARIHQSEPMESTVNQMLSSEATEKERAKRHANKENIKSEGYQDMISWYRGLGKSSDGSSKWYQGTDPAGMANKARSSLAASSYHAFGQLPQYDGAGDALVNGCSPRRRTRDDRETEAVQDPSAGQETSRAERAEAYDVGRTDTYDYRGLTHHEFTVAPDRPSNSRVHSQNVDRYLDRIQEEEVGEVAATYGREAATQQ